MPTAYLSLGSNLGDRAGNLEAALERLQSPAVRLTAVSSLYETAPVGETVTQAPMYLNLAARVDTSLSPDDLLAHTQAAEKAGGRVRSSRWAPRTIDIDVLLYDDLTSDSEWLTIPHPRMLERAFVLVPLVEIAPDLTLPDGSSIRERLESLGNVEQAVSRATDLAHRMP